MYSVISNSEWKCIANVKNIPFTTLLAMKQVEWKDLPKIYPIKSEAELILDELQKVVDKAEEILGRSGRQMDYKYPLCTSQNCPVESKCSRKLNGEESQKVDYAKVDMGNNDKCVWLMEMKGELVSDE